MLKRFTGIFPILFILFACADTGDNGPSGSTASQTEYQPFIHADATTGARPAPESPAGFGADRSAVDDEKPQTPPISDDPKTGTDPSETSSPETDEHPVPQVEPLTVLHACNASPPAGVVLAPAPLPYTGGKCPSLANGINSLTSSGSSRKFMLVYPEDAKEGEVFPVLFLWHWLKGSAKSFYKKGQIQAAVETQRFVAVIPEAKGDLFLQWPFDLLTPEARHNEEVTFFDDMLSCVADQLDINLNCVSSVGVSAGALWTVQLAMARSEHLNTMISLSGGVGVVTKPWDPPVRKLPSLVLWGGPFDSCVLCNFQDVSQMLEDHLIAAGHFLLECVHNCRHGEPPMEPIEGKSKYAPIWEFAFDHPYWLSPGESPYEVSGMPQTYPNWCAIGAGNATIRVGDCEPPGCPF